MLRRLPYVLTVLFPLQLLLATVGLRYLVYVVLAGGTAVLYLRAAIRGRAASGLGPVWLFLTWVALLVAAHPGLVSAYGFLVYAQFALFWMGYFYAYGAVDLERLTRANLAVASFVALTGLYQLVDPTLSGLLPAEQIAAFALEGGLSRRINGIFPSPMMLGAYLVLSALLGLTLRRTPAVVAGVGLCLLGSLLTGNKSTTLSLGAAVIYGVLSADFERGRRLRPLILLFGGATVYLTLLLTGAAWGPVLAEFSPRLYRAVAPFFFAGGVEQFGLVLAYWSGLFLLFGGSAVELVVGHGPGLTRQETTFFGGERLGAFPVAEGYLVQILFELGVVGLVLWHMVLWPLLTRARASRPKGRIGYDHVMVALYFNMIAVHVFAGIYTGFLWGYFVSLLNGRRDTHPSASPEPLTRVIAASG